MTISPIIGPCRGIWDNYAQSMGNKNILIKSTKGILKTKHNGKSNAGYVTISTHQTRLKAKAYTEKREPHPEKQLIEITQIRHGQRPPLGSFNTWKN